MRQFAALCCLMVVLSLGLTWELMAPERDTIDPLPADAPPVATNANALPAAPDADALTAVAASIIERPLFSPTRRPGNTVASASGSASEAADQGLPRLTGTIVGPSGKRAIFAGADGKSRTAAEGDAVGAFKVRTIDPGLVTLSGSQGDRMLRPTYDTGAAANAAPAGENVVFGTTNVAQGTARGVRPHEAGR